MNHNTIQNYNEINNHYKDNRKGRQSLILVMFILIFSLGAKANPVEIERARQVATTFLNHNGAKSIQLTDLSKKAGFPNLYIFNAEPGFVVMAADDCVQPILGYSLTGRFVAENMPTNVSGWLQGYNDEIQYAIDNGLKASDETTRLWKDLIEENSKAAKTTTVVAPLVQTTWDQNGFHYYSGGQWLVFELYNNLCPYDYYAGERTVTGCVATAMAQIMKFWNYPAHGIGSHSYIPLTRPDLGEQYADFGSTNYNWSNMPNALSNTSTEEEIYAIATLMYHCGVSVNMMYDISSNGGSGAYSEDIPDALINYFNYKTTANLKLKSDYSNNDWIDLLKTELNASRPIEYNGRGAAGGHAFVCDGYDSNNNFHFNWGWSGNNDGFFALTSLNPGSGGAGGGGYDFTQQQNAILGIEPSTTIPSPSNLTYTLSGSQDVTLSWEASIGASSYNVYRNNTLIGNVTSTTYTDTAPYGTNDYFIRAMDSDGQLSLPSNTVTVTIDYPTPVVDDLAAIVSDNNVNLTWTAPEWCYPATPTETMTYGDDNNDGSIGYNGTYNMYWGHRYLASNLSSYNNMKAYKVSFYANTLGSYQVFIYQGTSSDHPQMQLLQQSFSVESLGWFDIDLSTPIQIDASQDLWVFIYDPEFRNYPATYCSYSGDYGNYYSLEPTSWVNTMDNSAFLIRTFITDGIYTYNVYRNDIPIANNVNDTTYNDNDLSAGTYSYYVKTNYYAGESNASNQVTVQIGNDNTSQTSTFSQGYNWWGTYIEQDSIDGLSMLQEALGNNGVTIRSQTSGYNDYYEGYGWFGSLSGINNESSYKVITSAPCSVTLTGNLAIPSQHPITLNQGWSWIGYVPSTAMDVNAAMVGLTSTSGDKLKSQQGYSDYYEGYGWFGSLNTIEPGMGLMYYSVNSQPVSFTYPNNGRDGELQKNLTAENNHWEPNPHAYPTNMTLLAVIDLDGEEIQSEDYELAVFDANGECRGSIMMMYIDITERYYAFLTIYGDVPVELHFGLYDYVHEECFDVDETLTFNADASIGTIFDPLVLHFHSMNSTDELYNCVEMYPNPVHRGDNISIDLCSHTKNPVRMEIVNTLGVIVEVVHAPSVQTITAPNVAGVYTMRIITKDKGVLCRKLIVK